jgi:hypothetical protein
MKIIHLRAAIGGIAAYGERIEAIYERSGFEVEIITVDATTDYRRLSERLAKVGEALCHFEIGAGDGQLLALSRRLLRLSRRPQLMTIHDPGVVVWSRSKRPRIGTQLSASWPRPVVRLPRSPMAAPSCDTSSAMHALPSSTYAPI